jgi:hypothetical protein
MNGRSLAANLGIKPMNIYPGNKGYRNNKNKMKKPIFTEEQRRSWYSPELEVAKLKFKREFEKSNLGRLMKRIVEWLAKVLS